VHNCPWKIVAKENQITVLDHEEGTWVEKTSEDPLGEPSKIASNWQPVPIDGLPDVFCGESPNSFALLIPLDVKA
jgi:anthranilate synthase component 1